MIKIINTNPCEYVAIKLDNINVGILKIKIIIDEAEFKYLSSNNFFDFKYKTSTQMSLYKILKKL